MTLHDRDAIRHRLEDSVFAGQDLSKQLPRYRFPVDEMMPTDAYQVVHDELILDGNSRQNLATFCQTWEEPEVHAPDGPVHRQEHDRQGRVPPDRRAGAPLRAHARRPVELAGLEEHHRRLRDRLVRGVHARRHGRQVALARQARGRGQAHRQAQHGLRPGAGGVAQVRQVLGHRDARDPDVAGQLLHDARGRARARRREHHLRRADPRGHLHRCLRAGEGDRRGARPAPGGHRARHRPAHRRRERWVPGAVLRARTWSGTSGSHA